MTENAIFVGTSDADQFLLLKYANRHGLVAGATGTGKTVTLQTIAEGFSAFGVPVFMADVKGDLSGIAKAGGDNPRAVERAQQLGIEGYAGRGFPTIFWDLFGEKGHPVRTTVSGTMISTRGSPPAFSRSTTASVMALTCSANRPGTTRPSRTPRSPSIGFDS